jgi:hypothetical protein
MLANASTSAAILAGFARFAFKASFEMVAGRLSG